MAKKTDDFLKWGGIAFIIYLVGTKIATMVSDNIDFGSPRIILGAVQWTGPFPVSVNATIIFPLINNNPVSFPLDNLLANIIYGEYVLATLRMNQPIVIESGETTELQFETSLNFADLGGNIADIVTSRQYLQALRFAGNASSKGVTFPFSNTISVG